MTKHKAEKRAVRERMAKTGERYTTARHYFLDLHHVEPENEIADSSTEEAALRLSDPDSGAEAGAEASAPASAGSTAPDWVEQPGMSDESIQRNTGKTWEEWFALLDQWGATERTHAAIARYVDETSDIGGWWAQSVTVGYERARGMRKRHERPDGFSVNASKTVAVPVARLFAAFLDEALRDQWLDAGTLRVRTSQPERSARFDVIPAGTVLTATFIAKSDAKSSVQLQELKIAAEDDVESRKAFWKANLNRLAATLTT